MLVQSGQLFASLETARPDGRWPSFEHARASPWLKTMQGQLCGPVICFLKEQVEDARS